MSARKQGDAFEVPRDNEQYLAALQELENIKPQLCSSILQKKLKAEG